MNTTRIEFEQVADAYRATLDDHTSLYHAINGFKAEITEVRRALQEIEDDTLLDDESIDGKNAEIRAAQLRRALHKNTQYVALEGTLQRKQAELDSATVEKDEKERYLRLCYVELQFIREEQAERAALAQHKEPEMER